MAGFGNFIAESPGKFLAMLGAGSLIVAAFVAGAPTPVALNPWALDPDKQARHSPLDRMKEAANRYGARFGIHFDVAPVVMPESFATRDPARPRPHRRRHPG